MVIDSATHRSGRASWLVFFLVTAAFLVTTHQWDLTLTDRLVEFQEMNVENINPESPIRRVVFPLIGLLGLLSLLRPDGPRLTARNPVAWLVLFLVGWAFLSVLWSADLGLTMRRLVSFSLLSVGAIALGRRFAPDLVTLMVFVNSSAFLLIGFLAELDNGAFQPMVDGYRFEGTQSANNQAMNCSFMVLSGLAGADVNRSHKAVFYLGAAVGFIFLILTKSRTSFASTLLAILAYKILVQNSSRTIVVVFMIVLVLLGSFLVFGASTGSMLGSSVNLGRGSDGAETLNGRKWLWMECRGYAGQRKLHGYGFNGFWSPDRIEAISRAQGWTIVSGHSIYVDLILDLGLIGFGALIALLGFAVVRSGGAFRLTGDIGMAFFFAFFVYYSLHGVLESMFVRPGYPAFISMVVFSCLAFSTDLDEVKKLRRGGGQSA